jgi:hypothetical protein
MVGWRAPIGSGETVNPTAAQTNIMKMVRSRKRGEEFVTWFLPLDLLTFAAAVIPAYRRSSTTP